MKDQEKKRRIKAEVRYDVRRVDEEKESWMKRERSNTRVSSGMLGVSIPFDLNGYVFLVVVLVCSM